MKKILLGIIFIIGFVCFYFLLNNSKKKNGSENSFQIEPVITDNFSATPSPSPIQKMQQISFSDSNYLYAYTITKENHKVELFPNYDQKTESSQLKINNNCKFLVNAGFYSQDNKPIGWFLSQNQEYSSASPNQLFNGYIFSTIDQTITISNIFPSEPVFWGLQTGPLLIEDCKQNVLDLKTDKFARRLIAGINKNNQLVFIVVTSKEALTSGPLLKDLPAIIFQINNEENLGITTAINLDGGMASAYISQDIEIKEYTPIGSFFCIKN